MENINFNDFENICRFCMFNCDIKFTQDSVISDIFYKLTNIHFERNDELPQQICQKCFDKINEIREFTFQCKRTHSSLTKCLNNYKKSRLNEEQDVAGNTNILIKSEVLIKVEPDILIDEHKFEFVDYENLNSTNDYVNEELEINRNVLENTINELKDEMIPEKIDENINYSDDDLLIPNTSYIEAQYEEESLNTKLNDLSNDSNSLKSSDNTVIDSAEINKKQSDYIKHKPYKCDVCYKTFRHLISCKRHECPHKCARPYKCEKCSMSFITTTQLKRHMRTHSGVHKCDQCSKSFNESADLKKHMYTHSGEGPYKCGQCSKSFNGVGSLNYHIRKHSGECVCKCDQCSKMFSQIGLKIHRRTHSGERVHKCDQCAKSFKYSGHLKRHMHTHSGECPYKCDQCWKSFSHSGYLKIHMRTHRGERPYKCDQCWKSFSHPCNLKTHMRAHSGERPLNVINVENRSVIQEA